MIRRLAAATAGLAVALVAAADPPLYAHSPAIEAAQAALPRARIVPLHGTVRDITGLSSATTGRVTALRDLATDLRAAGLIVSGSDAGMRVTIPEQLLFDFDHADLRADAPAKLAALAKGAETVPMLPIAIEGHTDSKGSSGYNAKLSLARAEAVRAWLGEHGVAEIRLSAHGYGATRPIAPNTTTAGQDDPAGRQKNRRVEVVIGRG